MKRSIFLLFTLNLILSACSPKTGISPQTEVDPIEPPPPTHTVLPDEPTSTIEPIATADPVIFRDPFEGKLNSAWRILNEDPENWMITTNGWLVISADDPSVLSSGQEIRQANFLFQPAPGGDFVVTTRLITNPLENFQQAGIFLLLDGENYVSILNAFCEPCLPNNGGYGIFMEGFKNAESIAEKKFIPRAPDETDVFLRLVYSAINHTVTGYYTSYPGTWQEVGVIDGVSTFSKVGLGAANTPGPATH